MEELHCPVKQAICSVCVVEIYRVYLEFKQSPWPSG